MKLTVLILLSLFIFSCKSDQEKNIEKLDKAIHEYIENEAFRENKQVKLLQVSNISYEMVGASTIDSARRYHYSKKQDEFLDLGERYVKLVGEETSLIRLSRETDMPSLTDEYIRSAKEHMEMAHNYQDSVNHYAKLDSVLAVRMKARKQDTKTYFNTKFFCKATVGNENILDTLRFLFDKDFRFVK